MVVHLHPSQREALLRELHAAEGFDRYQARLTAKRGLRSVCRSADALLVGERVLAFTRPCDPTVRSGFPLACTFPFEIFELPGAANNLPLGFPALELSFAQNALTLVAVANLVAISHFVHVDAMEPGSVATHVLKAIETCLLALNPIYSPARIPRTRSLADHEGMTGLVGDFNCARLVRCSTLSGPRDTFPRFGGL